jgi:hypothetical protein
MTDLTAVEQDVTAVRSDVSKYLAGMLGELEDHHTALMRCQARLQEMMGDVQTELERVEAVKAAASGRPEAKRQRGRRSPARPSGGAAGYRSSPAVQARKDAVAAFAREHSDGFATSEVAAALDEDARGLGPLLSYMQKDGTLTSTGDGSNKRWHIA